MEFPVAAEPRVGFVDRYFPLGHSLLILLEAYRQGIPLDLESHGAIYKPVACLATNADHMIKCSIRERMRELASTRPASFY